MVETAGKPTEGQPVEETMSLSDLTKLICGAMEYVFQINKDVEITLRELNQKDLVDIDNELQERGLKPDVSSGTYMSNLRVLKIVKAFKTLSFNGKAVEIDIKKLEEEIEQLKNLK